jgi:hypothetical protein
VAASTPGRRFAGGCSAAAVLAEGVQFLDREIALHRQHGIQRRGRVALGQDEAIPQRIIRPFRIDVQHMPIGRGQNIGAGQRRGQMRRLRGVRHLDDLAT